MADGRIVIDTKVDSSGIENGISNINSIAKTGLKGFLAAIGGAVTAIGGLSIAAIKIGSDFEAQMSRVKAISGATGEEFTKLNDLAIKLGADTSFSAKEAAKGMENLASAGFNVDEIMVAMPGMLNLAASSGEDLAMSADIAASTLRGFGLAADQAGHVADVLAKNAADTNAAIVDTGYAMKYIAPVARTAGWSFESVTAAIGAMADAGIKGEQAGTTLRGALTRLMKPSKPAAKAMDAIGFAAYDASGKMKPLSQMISELNEKTKNLTEEQRNQYIAQIFGTEALSGMTVLLQKGAPELDKMTESLKNSNGASAQMASTMRDNLKGGIDQFKGAIESLGIQLYQSVDNPLKDVVQSAAGMVGELSKAFKNGGFEGLVKQVGATLSIIVTEIAQNGPKMIDAAVMLISSFITGLQNNVMPISQGATSIITSLVKGLLSLLPQMLQLGLQFIIQLALGITQALPEFLSTSSNMITSFINSFVQLLPQLIMVAIQLIQTLATGIIQALPQMLPAILQLIIGICDTIIANIGTIVDIGIELLLALVQGIVQCLPTLIEEIPRIINSFADAIYAQLPKILKAGIDILLMLIKGLIDSIPTLIANLPQIIMAIVNVITLYNWASLGKNLITWLGDGLSAMKSNIGNIAANIAEWVSNTITNIFKGGFSWGKNLISSLGEGFSSMVSFLGNSARSVASGALDSIKGIFSGGLDIGKNLIMGIWDGISNMKQWILDKIGGFAGTIVSGIKDFFGIHSPSRVMRDEVGKYLAQGIGVGFDNESNNLQKDIENNLSGLTAKMKTTVDYETASTTARVVAYNNRLSGGAEEDNGNSKENPITVVAKFIIDGKEFTQTVVAPNQDVLSDYYKGR